MFDTSSLFISQLVYEDADLSDAEKVYAECDQPRALPWEECILPQRMKQCVKIGEGTFGEVFSTTNALGDKVALKVRVFLCCTMCCLKGTYHAKCTFVRLLYINMCPRCSRELTKCQKTQPSLFSSIPKSLKKGLQRI